MFITLGNRYFAIWKSNYENTLINTHKQQFGLIGQNCYMQYPVLITGETAIFIGNNFFARRNLRLEAISNYLGKEFDPIIKIGNNVHIEANCHIGCINGIDIKDNVLIASNVLIIDHNHGNINDIHLPPLKRDLQSSGKITIGENSWIGENVSILANINIGKGCVVGSNSVVTSDLDEYCIYAGVPAKKIKTIKRHE